METSTLTDSTCSLRHLTKTAPDPRVRRRAHAAPLMAEGVSVVEVARLFETAPHRVRARRSRFRERGPDGLADELRRGRPPKPDATALALQQEALEADPQAYGVPVTIWSIRDLRELLARRLGVRVCVRTIWRAVHRLGYRYRRPRHDLRHRQNREAVAAARQVLGWLQGKAPPVPPQPTVRTSSTWMSARCIATHGWRRYGSGGAGR